MSLRRTVERAEPDGTFQKVEYGDLKIGDRFRMFEPDGSPVTDRKGGTVWTCDSAPFVTGHDAEGEVLGVDIAEAV